MEKIKKLSMGLSGFVSFFGGRIYGGCMCGGANTDSYGIQN